MRLGSHKVGLLLAAGLGVAALAVGLFVVAAAQQRLNSLERMQQGVAYVRVLFPEMVALSQRGSTAAPLPGSRALGTAMAAWDVTFGTAALSAAYRELRAELRPGKHPAAARHAAARLVRRVALAAGLDAARLERVFGRTLVEAVNLAPLVVTRLVRARYAPVYAAADAATAGADAARLAALLKGSAGAQSGASAYSAAAANLEAAVARGVAGLGSPAGRAAIDLEHLYEAHGAFDNAALRYAEAIGSQLERQLQSRQAAARSELEVAVAATAVVAVTMFAVLAAMWRAGHRREQQRKPRTGGYADAGGKTSLPQGAQLSGASMAFSLSRVLGNVKLTTTIAVMVVLGMAAPIGAVLATLAMSLTDNARNSAAERLAADVRTTAAILEVYLPGSDVYWTEAGELERIEARAMPKFRTHDLIDTIGRVTGDTATFLVYEPETDDFVSRTTTILAEDGERAIGTSLAKDGAVWPVVKAGDTYMGEADVLGVAHYTTYQPILNLAGEVIGALSIGIPKAEIEGTIAESLRLLAAVSAVALLVTGTIAVLISRIITRPIPKLSAAMERIADGALDTEVPFTGFHNEIGAMARNVEGFRENAARVVELTEAEVVAKAQRAEERAAMMQSFERSFGEVVGAAVRGDFSRRVDGNFSDAELSAFANDINNLVATVEGGLADTSRALSALARADLTHRVEGKYEGAFARLMDDTNGVADRLAEIVIQLGDMSRALKLAAGEILSGANHLGERTTRQAATIEETSAAMEQLAASVLENAKRARDASDAAGVVTRTAEDGGRVMSEANEAMERITASSAKIASIIGLIDDIAFQTNLLALNASVEAARAGEAGKGFAVVAVEVRRLAQSAAQASAEVKGLIEQSGTEVATGTKVVAAAASRLSAMVLAARTSNELMDGIARESREQAAAIEEVSAAVRQLDEMTQHNAALVEQTKAAIEQAEAQARELDDVVDVFTVGDTGTRRLAADTAAPGPRVSTVGVRALQDRVASAARTYLGGAHAVAKNWEEL